MKKNKDEVYEYLDTILEHFWEEWLKDAVEDDEDNDDECGDEDIVSDLIDMIIETSRPPVVKRIISSEPATTIIWEDKTKTTVKCMETDTFDVEKGVMMAYLTKLLGKTELKKLLDSVEFQEKVVVKNRKKPVFITVKKRKSK